MQRELTRSIYQGYAHGALYAMKSVGGLLEVFEDNVATTPGGGVIGVLASKGVDAIKEHLVKQLVGVRR